MQIGQPELFVYLKSHDGYETPPRARSFVDRMLGWSDLWYYAKVVRIVVAGGRCARRGGYTREYFARQSYDMLRAVEGSGAKVLVTGLKNLACLTAPAVIVSNHMSLLETFLLPGFILPFREVAIVVKESLLRYPAFGQILRAVNAISVKRENPREDFRKIMECGRQALESGRCVLVFPQSTRSPEFNPAEFNSVGVKLAARSSVPVIPLALKTDFVGIGRIVRDLGRLDRSKPVYFSFGAPFQVTSPREAHEKVVAFISERLRSWGVKVYAEANKGIRELNEQHVD